MIFIFTLRGRSCNSFAILFGCVMYVDKLLVCFSAPCQTCLGIIFLWPLEVYLSPIDEPVVKEMWFGNKDPQRILSIRLHEWGLKTATEIREFVSQMTQKILLQKSNLFGDIMKTDHGELWILMYMQTCNVWSIAF